MMLIFLAIPLAALLQAPALDNSIALSVTGSPNSIQLFQRVRLTITLTNRSEDPQYVYRDLANPLELEFAVRGPDGKLVRGFNDPPPPPPIPKNSKDLVRIEGNRSIRCVVETPLTDLGIGRAGVFSITGFWHGVSLRVPEIDLKEQNFSFSFTHAETVKLRVTGGRSQANIASQPMARGSSSEAPTCSAAEVVR
jgi:hypothetical protein